MDQNEEEEVKVNHLKLPIILLEPPDHGSGEPSNGVDKGAVAVSNGPLLSEDDNRLHGLSPGLKMF